MTARITAVCSFFSLLVGALLLMYFIPLSASAESNLIVNPSLETSLAATMPAHWHMGGYGNNTRTFKYPVAGPNGASDKAIEVAVTQYQSGDAKWFPDNVAITGGDTYQFSDEMKSTAPTIVDVRFTLANGSFVYKDVATFPVSDTYKKVSAEFVAPDTAVSATVFHLLKQAGVLDTDDYSISQVQSNANNYVANGDLEIGTSKAPQGWVRGGWGANTRTFTYPVAGRSGRGAQVSVSGYQSGDAKWTTGLIALSPGSYTYSDSYEANVPTILTVQFEHNDGSFTYQDLKTLPAAPSWSAASATFTVPDGVKAARVFHLIKQNGTLAIDSVSITDANAVSAQPDTPQLDTPASLQVAANARTSVPGVYITDPFAEINPGRLALNVDAQHGTVYMTHIDNSAITGSGSASISYSGTLAWINYAASTLQYQPNAGTTNDTITIMVYNQAGKSVSKDIPVNVQ